MLILLQCLWSVISTHHPDIDLLCQALQALAISRTPFLLGAQGEVIWLPENNMHSSCSHPFRLCHQTIWFLKDKEVSLFFFFPPLDFLPVPRCWRAGWGRLKGSTRVWHTKEPICTPRRDQVLLTAIFLDRSSVARTGKMDTGLIDSKGSS